MEAIHNNKVINNSPKNASDGKKRMEELKARFGNIIKPETSI